MTGKNFHRPSDVNYDGKCHVLLLVGPGLNFISSLQSRYPFTLLKCYTSNKTVFPVVSLCPGYKTHPPSSDSYEGAWSCQWNCNEPLSHYKTYKPPDSPYHSEAATSSDEHSLLNYSFLDFSFTLHVTMLHNNNTT